MKSVRSGITLHPSVSSTFIPALSNCSNKKPAKVPGVTLYFLEHLEICGWVPQVQLLRDNLPLPKLMGFRLLFPLTNQKEQLSSILQLIKALTLQNAEAVGALGWTGGFRITELPKGAAWKNKLVLGLVVFVGEFFPHFTELEDQVFVHFLSKSTGLHQQHVSSSNHPFSERRIRKHSPYPGKHRHQGRFCGVFFDRSLQFWLRLVKKPSKVGKDWYSQLMGSWAQKHLA